MGIELIGLVSTWDDADLLESCLRSLRTMDYVTVWHGPTNVPTDSQKQTKKLKGTEYGFEGEWESDAAKRTEMLLYAKSVGMIGMRTHPDYWGLWLDSDEVLLWGEYLHDYCNRASQETATGGTTLRIVEYDGSVAQCYGKLIRLDAVKRYVMSSYEIELSNGMIVALPNVPICSAGGLPIGNVTDVNDPLLAINRPPLQGEPHLLHRHGLRSKDRNVERLHETEAEFFQDLVRDAGLEGVDSAEHQNRAMYLLHSDKPKTVEGISDNG